MLLHVHQPQAGSLIEASRKDFWVILPQSDASKMSARLNSWKAHFRIYLRILALLRPHWIWTLGAIACLGLSTGFALIVPWLLGWVINTGLQHGQFGTLLL